MEEAGLFDMRRMMGSHVARLVVVGVLVLVLQIPVVMISVLIRERQQRAVAATREVTSKWGEAQQIAGPALVIPYKHHAGYVLEKGRRVSRDEIRYATFLPDRLLLDGKARTETRFRGIFAVPTYRVALQLKGEFHRPSFADLGIDERDVLWKRAQLALGISDIKAIQRLPALKWNGEELNFSPGIGEAASIASVGTHASVPVQAGGRRFFFSIPLLLNGSKSAYFVPFGRDTLVRLRSNWESPSFQGNWLPATHRAVASGFDATWKIPFLGRTYPQAWTSERSMIETIRASRFGVNLITSVDEYRMAERSVKYAPLFILLTFAAVWLIEVLQKVKVHPLQYLLLGFAMCIFYAGAVTLRAPAIPAGIRCRNSGDRRDDHGLRKDDAAIRRNRDDPWMRRRRALRLPVRAAHQRGLCTSRRIDRALRRPRGDHVLDESGQLVRDRSASTERGCRQLASTHAGT